MTELTESPEGALIKALVQALKNINGVFGNEIYQNKAPQKAGDTYCIMFWAGGGRTQEIMLNNTQNFIYSVKCIASKLSVASTGQAEILAAIDEKGTQQVADATTLDGGPDWEIVTCFADRAISSGSVYAEVDDYYQRGNQFRIRMEGN